MRSISCWLGHAVVRVRDNSSYLPVARLLWAGEVSITGEGRFTEGLGRVDSPVSRISLAGDLGMCAATALSARCLMSSSTRPSRASTRLLLEEGIGSSGWSWLTHVVPRRLQFSQTASLVAAKIQRTLRRLHSQQLWVPLRTFLRLDSGSSTKGLAPTIAHRSLHLRRLFSVILAFGVGKDVGALRV